MKLVKTRDGRMFIVNDLGRGSVTVKKHIAQNLTRTQAIAFLRRYGGLSAGQANEILGSAVRRPGERQTFGGKFTGIEYEYDKRTDRFVVIANEQLDKTSGFSRK